MKKRLSWLISIAFLVLVILPFTKTHAAEPCLIEEDGVLHYYNENGEHVYYDDNGDILFVSDY